MPPRWRGSSAPRRERTAGDQFSHDNPTTPPLPQSPAPPQSSAAGPAARCFRWPDRFRHIATPGICPRGICTRGSEIECALRELTRRLSVVCLEPAAPHPGADHRSSAGGSWRPQTQLDFWVKKSENGRATLRPPSSYANRRGKTKLENTIFGGEIGSVAACTVHSER